MKIKLTKLGELKDELYPHNYPVGYETIRSVFEPHFSEPTVGERFNIGSFSTSPVQKILSPDTFQTLSSIYKWERVADDAPINVSIRKELCNV